MGLQLLSDSLCECTSYRETACTSCHLCAPPPLRHALPGDPCIGYRIHHPEFTTLPSCSQPGASPVAWCGSYRMRKPIHPVRLPLSCVIRNRLYRRSWAETPFTEPVPLIRLSAFTAVKSFNHEGKAHSRVYLAIDIHTGVLPKPPAQPLLGNRQLLGVRTAAQPLSRAGQGPTFQITNPWSPLNSNQKKIQST